MTNAAQLAIMAVSNTLPDTLDIDALPAIRDAVKGIITSDRLGAVVAAQQAGQIGEGPKKALDGLTAALSALGAKLAPHMSGPQASAWKDAIMLSLSKYPLKVAKKAIEEAQGTPFPHGIGSVDAKLHELADKHDRTHRAAVMRLKTLERKLNAPPIALPPPDDSTPAPPMALEEVMGLPLHLIRLGTRLGYIRAEDAEKAMEKEKDTSHIDTEKSGP